MRRGETTDVETTVLDITTAFVALGVGFFAWLLLSLLVLLERARYDARSRMLRDRTSLLRGSRAEHRLLRRAASTPRTELGRWRRIAALRRLAGARHPACRTLLPAALADPHEDVVGAAVRSLGDLQSDWAARLLLAELTSGAHARSRVATQLDRFAPRLRNELAALLEVRDPAVRYWAATLLARYDDAPVAALVRAADDADGSVRAAAVETLGVVREGSARPRLLAALRDDDWVVRLHACRALGRVGSAHDADSVAALLGDGRWWVRAAAKDALRALAPGSLPALVRAVDDADPFARNGAAEVLQDLGFVDELMVSGADPALLEAILRAGGERLRSAALARDLGSDRVEREAA